MTARRFVLAAVAALASGASEAATTVAVLEIGKGGVARRTKSASSLCSVAGVSSFWNSMHHVDNGSKHRNKAFQHPGMTVVPDFFHRANGGLAVGLVGSAVDLESMPTVAGLLEGGSHAANLGVVGHFHLSGSQGLALMEKASRSKQVVESASFGSLLQEKATDVAEKGAENTLEAVTVKVDNEGAAARADAQLASMLESLQKQAADSGSTIVVHLVIDEEVGAARRRLMSRRLEDEQEDEDEDEEEDEDDNENNNNNNNNKYNNAYYSAGYMDADGNWHSSYKTIFQIQYFNVVLWTAIGLTAILFVSVGLMMYMPLMADTLLFGESAKMMGE